MGQVDLIIIMGELHLKGECVVEAASLLLQGILEVTDVLAIAVPARGIVV